MQLIGLATRVVNHYLNVGLILKMDLITNHPANQLFYLFFLKEFSNILYNYRVILSFLTVSTFVSFEQRQHCRA